MDFLGRAKRAQPIPQLDTSGNLAVKLLRTYTAQVEALAKLRRGGEQTVRVEHVHVHAGGQAVGAGMRCAVSFSPQSKRAPIRKTPPELITRNPHESWVGSGALLWSCRSDVVAWVGGIDHELEQQEICGFVYIFDVPCAAHTNFGC
jgi:hypothetical protein